MYDVFRDPPNPRSSEDHTPSTRGGNSRKATRGGLGAEVEITPSAQFNSGFDDVPVVGVDRALISGSSYNRTRQPIRGL